MTQEGLMLVSYGSHGLARLDDGTTVQCQYRRQVGRPYCGDRVTLAISEDGAGVVEAIQARRNEFARASAQQRKSTIAANLDQVLIVISPRPEPSRDLVERYLLAVHSLSISPIIILNKAELSKPQTGYGADVLRHLPAYRTLGYVVVETSCKGPPGVDALLPVLTNKTSILVGQSGVGKSSLVRQLLPDLEIQTGAVSRATGKGTHTTTTTILYDLPGGGFLMDSPGVWEYGLWKLDAADIAEGFVEFRPMLGACRFNDCRHDNEPGCEIKEAVSAGTILQWRYESYLRLLSQN